MTGPTSGPSAATTSPAPLLLTAGHAAARAHDRRGARDRLERGRDARRLRALRSRLLAAFVAVERRTAQPLVRLGIFRSGPLVRANLGAMCLFGAYVGFQFVATLYLQGTLGWSALETALAFLPGGLLVAFGAPRMGAVISRYGTTRPILASTIAFAAGYALFLPVDATPVPG